MTLSKEFITEKLKGVQDPELRRDIVSLGMIKEIGINDKDVFIHLEITSPKPEIKTGITESIESVLKTESEINEVTVQISGSVSKGPANAAPKAPLPGIKYIIAVSSGKGGVGKSTVAVNLAYALVKSGLKVGLMDGDIYGPNIPLMLGVSHDQKPLVNEQEKLIPIDARGLKMISMGILVPPDQPMVWRGPMLHSAVSQFLQKVEWGELDVLLVDLPPGTGDVQLSLVQTVPLSGAVIVTTPQEVALLDVRKGVAMFKKTGVPILGLIENMSSDIFGRGGGKTASKQFDVPFLGEIPLEQEIREGGDSGNPIVLSSSSSGVPKAFTDAAEMLMSQFNQTAV